jgi:hypothetical protein
MEQMENFDHILLFKTNIRDESCKEKMQAILDGYEGINQWNVALDDDDCVLRIISYTLSTQQIINLINTHGFECCELT